MKLIYIIVFFLNIPFIHSQKKFDVTVKLELDSMENELPEILSFFPRSIYKESGTTYKGKDLGSGNYNLRIRILNYESLDTLIHVSEYSENNHLIHLNKITNPYSFDSDLESHRLKLFISVNGPTVFKDTEITEKFESKFGVSIASSYSSCFKDNTDYELQYSRKVISYLDQEFGGRWRKLLKTYDLKPYE